MDVKYLLEYIVIIIGISFTRSNSFQGSPVVEPSEKNLNHELSIEHFIVSLREVNDNDRHICSGLILNKWFILTTGRCAQPYEPDQVNILAGFREIGYETNSRKRVAIIKVHSLFNHLTLEHNVAVIEIKDPFEFDDDFIFDKFLNTEISSQTICEEYGWNLKLKTDENEETLHKVKMLSLSHEECQEHFNPLNISLNGLMCTTVSPNMETPCQEDFGTILFCNDELAGMAAWGCRYPQNVFPKLFSGIKHEHIFWIKALSASPDLSLVSRITGGEPVENSEILYQVLIRDISKDEICGGSIIDIKSVLTAAHCVFEKDKVNLKIISNKRSNNQGQSHSLEKIIVHENFTRRNGTCVGHTCPPNNDIAILQIAGKFPSNITPVKLPSDKVAIGAICQVSGYGKTNYKEMTLSPTKTKLSIVDIEECRKVWEDRTMPETVICATDAEMKSDSCKGDSGGPLVCNDTLTGIVSFGEAHCTSRRPSVHTEVRYYISWIKKRIPTLLTTNGSTTVKPKMKYKNSSSRIIITNKIMLIMYFIAQLLRI